MQQNFGFRLVNSTDPAKTYFLDQHMKSLNKERKIVTTLILYLILP